MYRNIIKISSSDNSKTLCNSKRKIPLPKQYPGNYQVIYIYLTKGGGGEFGM